MSTTIGSTLGAASIGFYVSCVVFGVFTTQIFVYFRRFPSDRLAYKVLLRYGEIRPLAPWSNLEFVDQIFIAYSVYYYTITHYSDPAVLFTGSVIWSLIVRVSFSPSQSFARLTLIRCITKLQITMASMVGTIVKCCFAMRVWRFSKKNMYMTGTIAVMIFAQFALAIVFCIKGFQIKSLLHLHDLQVIGSLALGGGVLTDILIAMALLYCLRKLRTGVRKADTLIKTLSLYALNTGVLTGAVSLTTLLLYNLCPNTFYFMATYFTLGKLYAISFLCALNTRKVLRGKGTDREGNTSNNTSQMRNTLFLVTTNGRVPRGQDNDNAEPTKSMEIGVHQEVSVVADVENALYSKSAVLHLLAGSYFKYLVILILLLETADQMFIGHLMYFYGISNYANPIVLKQATTTWSFILQLTVGAVVGTIVKTYFGFRVWRFSDRNIWVTGLIMLFTLGQLGLALAFSVEAFKLPSVFAVHQLQTLGTISLSVGVCTDVITAGALCYYLNRLRTGLESSDSLVDNLCSYAINTGVLTSTVSIATLVLVLFSILSTLCWNGLAYLYLQYNAVQENNLYFVAVYFILSKLYAISFMATLNTRRAVRGRGTDRQGHTSNHTNLFALGTRMPSMGPSDLEHWDKVDPPFVLQDAQAFPVVPKHYEAERGF
ncbi:hypothetical protein D9613_005804 [Agrocybe pediades]|uniref:DUF6534 domain-containing protein n=1 Tax=Agrocybe pediades TaxID=84607 RepID=A0A8H4QUW3_9AGAR|nr:hypothetical protein D9613_005804 [Agrocybe pediades]